MSCGKEGRRAAGGGAADTEFPSAFWSLPSSARAQLSVTPRPAGLSEADGLVPTVLSGKQMQAGLVARKRCPELQTGAGRPLGSWAASGSLAGSLCAAFVVIVCYKSRAPPAV